MLVHLQFSGSQPVSRLNYPTYCSEYVRDDTLASSLSDVRKLVLSGPGLAVPVADAWPGGGRVTAPGCLLLLLLLLPPLLTTYCYKVYLSLYLYYIAN
jgi:hypothetical protein